MEGVGPELESSEKAFLQCRSRVGKPAGLECAQQSKPRLAGVTKTKVSMNGRDLKATANRPV